MVIGQLQVASAAEMTAAEVASAMAEAVAVIMVVTVRCGGAGGSLAASRRLRGSTHGTRSSTGTKSSTGTFSSVVFDRHVFDKFRRKRISK